MLKRIALCAALAAIYVGPAAQAADGPPIAGSVADFSRIDPSLPAPDDPFTDAIGRPFSLADFKGKYLLLNLWATWCGPCVAEMPSLDRLQAKLGGADFAVLPISVDRGGAGQVAGFYEQHRIAHLGVYVDAANRLAQRMSVTGLPTSFLVDRNGRVVGSLAGGAQWDTPEALALIEYYLKNGAHSQPIPSAPPAPPDITPVSFCLPAEHIGPLLRVGPAQRVGMGFSPL